MTGNRDDQRYIEMARAAVSREVGRDKRSASTTLAKALELIRNHLFDIDFDEAELLRLLGDYGGDVEDYVRRFALELGESPNTYLTKVRVIGALQLIARTSLSMERITELLGWQTTKALARDCRSIYGLPSGELRRRAKDAKTSDETTQRTWEPEIPPLSPEERLRFAHRLADELGRWLTPEMAALLADGTLKVDPIVFELMKSRSN